MYSSLQLGSVALPTGPLSALLAVWLAIEIAARMGRRYDMSYDDLFGLFVFALAAGIIAARLWHVFSYWDVYRANWLDILSVRPSGLNPAPGLIGAGLAAYGFLIGRKLDPAAAAAATLTGLAAGGILYGMGSFLSGRIIGTESFMPWAVPYGDVFRHPTGLYQALGCALIWIVLWYRTLDIDQVLLTGLFLFSLLFLVTDAFLVYQWDSPLIRWPQVGYLASAVISALWLARRSARLAAAAPSPTTADSPDSLAPDSS